MSSVLDRMFAVTGRDARSDDVRPIAGMPRPNRQRSEVLPGHRSAARRAGYLCRIEGRSVPPSPDRLIQAPVTEGSCPRLQRTGAYG